MRVHDPSTPSGELQLRNIERVEDDLVEGQDLHCCKEGWVGHALGAELVEGVLEDVLAAHVDAQGAVVAVAGGADLAAEEGALVVKVDQPRRAHELRQGALQQQLHVLLDQHVHQPPVPLRKPAPRMQSGHFLFSFFCFVSLPSLLSTPLLQPVFGSLG